MPRALPSRKLTRTLPGEIDTLPRTYGNPIIVVFLMLTEGERLYALQIKGLAWQKNFLRSLNKKSEKIQNIHQVRRGKKQKRFILTQA
jgi:hypothetical protein